MSTSKINIYSSAKGSAWFVDSTGPNTVLKVNNFVPCLLGVPSRLMNKDSGDIAQSMLLIG